MFRLNVPVCMFLSSLTMLHCFRLHLHFGLFCSRLQAPGTGTGGDRGDGDGSDGDGDGDDGHGSASGRGHGGGGKENEGMQAPKSKKGTMRPYEMKCCFVFLTLASNCIVSYSIARAIRCERGRVLAVTGSRMQRGSETHEVGRHSLSTSSVWCHPVVFFFLSVRTCPCPGRWRLRGSYPRARLRMFLFLVVSLVLSLIQGIVYSFLVRHTLLYIVGKKKRQDKKDGAKSEAGVVLKIYVQNFMCHRKLSVPLCRRVLVVG